MTRPQPGFKVIDRRVTVADQVFDGLRGELMRCRIEAGHVFSIPSLTAQFGVSRTPVRDALARLVAEGALRDGPRGEVRVPPIDSAELMRLRDARCVVEGGLTALTAQQVTPRDVHHLAELSQAHSDAFASGDIQALLDANAAFHFGVYRLARNTMLFNMAETLWLRAGPYSRLLARLIEDRIQDDAAALYSHHHDDLIAALEARDPRAARDAMIADIKASATLLLPLLPGEPSSSV